MVEGAYDDFPPWFFDRIDPSDDTEFYEPPRLVTHIDDDAIRAVGQLYGELGIGASSAPRVIDLMASWISHFVEKPAWLTVLGMNALELANNSAASERVVHDLNSDPQLPFADASFDAATCCVSVDYLTRPIEVFDEAARVVRSEGVFACTFSNRCFPTKAITGWLSTDDDTHCALVREYFLRSTGWEEPTVERRATAGDPLFAVWARRKKRD
jgi:SAM-dependent methyltransferase